MTTWGYINLTASIIGMVIWLYWMKRNPKSRGYAYLPLSYLLHAIIFYSAYGAFNFGVEFMTTWSGILRLHGLILAVCGILLVESDDRWKTI